MTPRKSSRISIKSRRVELSSSESSQDDEEVVDNFYAEYKVRSESNGKTDKTPKKKEPPSYTTRSGRKVRSKFVKMDLGEESDQDCDAKSNSPPPCEKPSVLYEDDKAIESNMFSFQTPRRKQSMLAKATDSVSKTPKDGRNTPSRTPKSKFKLNVGVTPRATRARMTSKIRREAARQKEFVDGSESDYQPSESSDGDSSSSEEDAVPLDEIQEKEDVLEEKPPDPAVPIRASTRRRKPKCPDADFIYTSDNYFERKGTKAITSNHNLNKLKNPRLHQDQLVELLKEVNPRHKTVLTELDAENQTMFQRWLAAMSQGFNVLLYGVGSKRSLLNTFHAVHLSSCPTLVVNGYFPGITLKDILDSLASGVLKIKSLPAQPHEIVEAIAVRLKSTREPDVFVIVHNLDGAMLRNEKTQAALAELASLPKVHLVASMDHINAPLLWDQNKLSQFNFIWEDATTFLPYLDETSFESSLMVQRSGTIALTALRNVYQSLNVNARKVFRLLMEDQLKNGGNKSYQGMLFSDLYRACRNAFIVSSDLALRTQLTEFFDHKLVKHKRDTDHLTMPIDVAVLRQFNEEIDSM